MYFYVKKNAKHVINSTVITRKRHLHHRSRVLSCEPTPTHQQDPLDRSRHSSESLSPRLQVRTLTFFPFLLRAMEKIQLSVETLQPERKKHYPTYSLTYWPRKHKTPAKEAKQRLQIDLAGSNLQDLVQNISLWKHCSVVVNHDIPRVNVLKGGQRWPQNTIETYRALNVVVNVDRVQLWISFS